MFTVSTRKRGSPFTILYGVRGSAASTLPRESGYSQGSRAWGSDAWRYWVSEISQVLPPADYPIEDVPVTDPIFRSLIEVMKMPQIPNLPFWRGSGGRTTSEVGRTGPRTRCVSFVTTTGA